MKNVLKILLAIAVIIMAYITFQSINVPVRFDKIQKQREAAIQKRLKNIAQYEAAFESVYNRYATGEELKAFLANGKMYYVNAEGEYTDQMRDKGITERQAAAQGLIKRDTIWIPAKDSLLKGDVSVIAELLNIPGSSDKHIKIDTAYLEQVVGLDTIHVPVFQATALFTDYLGDLDPVRLQDKINMEEMKTHGFPGLKIGSLTEVKNTGNWE
ncbi:Uncharacterised protein [Porphyromonas macacae]|uniref:Uncharacterized protein n=1 Tax=Porphyromonas macacae TaxID=28115 RepID=A0A379EB26_9PORP|nr:hypothetical protein [Porphyromonas macacae]SUB89893.1 Uncharacterised protein [Porphyromonas macacae]